MRPDEVVVQDAPPVEVPAPGPEPPVGQGGVVKLGDPLVEDVVHHVLEGVGVEGDLVPHQAPEVQHNPARNVQFRRVIRAVPEDKKREYIFGCTLNFSNYLKFTYFGEKGHFLSKFELL